MKILLVEDSLTVRFLLTKWLENYGYTVIIANNGQQAWEILQQQHDIFLVLSDWMMPMMDGIQLCQAIRGANWPFYIYFILMTSKGDKNAVIQGMEAGADDFLIKPVNKDELRVRFCAGKRIIQLEQTLAKRNQALAESQRKIQFAYDQMSQNLEAAANTQKSLLPKPCTLGKIQFDWFFYPTSFVAGDMFNYFELGNEYLGFYQLDVVGHGVSSALLSFGLSHRIIAHSAQKELLVEASKQTSLLPIPPEKVVATLNHEFQGNIEQCNYFTMIYGYINQVTGEIRLTQAGHPKPVHLSRANRQARLCGDGGFPVGMLPNLNYESFSIQLQPGDRFFIYSDGVTECMNCAGEFFSESRLLQLIEETSDKPLTEVLKELGTNLKNWHNNSAFDDDVTMLAFERL